MHNLRFLISPIIIVIFLFLVSSVQKSFIYIPLVFALSVAVVNLKKLKVNNKALGIFVGIVQSYAVFLGLAIVMFFMDEFLQEYHLLGDNDSAFKGFMLVVLGGYFASLMLFYFYSFLFRIDNLRFGLSIITIGNLFMVVVMELFSNYEFFQFGVEKFTYYIVLWVIVMNLVYNVIINRKGVMKIID